MLEIFKDMVNQISIKAHIGTKLTPKYVTAVIIEFFHALIENSIPQQASMQNILIKFILDQRDYTTF